MTARDAGQHVARKMLRRLRGGAFLLAIRLAGGSAGWPLDVEKGTTFRHGFHRGIRVGRGVRLGRCVVIDVPPGAVLEIEDDAKVMHFCVIAAAEHVRIGRSTQIAEHTSIRDSDHGTALHLPMARQSITTPTFVGADVWIGRGVAVLRGSTIGDGAVIGANSVVRGPLESLGLYVGAPVRLVRMRR